MNCYLEICKNDIIKEVFNKEINIDKLKVEIIPEKKDRISISFKELPNRQIHLFNDEASAIELTKLVNIVHKKEGRKFYEQKFGFFYKDTENDKRERKQMLYRELVYSIFGITPFYKNSALYLPASRTGILLLYKCIFFQREIKITSFF